MGKVSISTEQNGSSSNSNGNNSTHLSDDSVINFDYGDPKLFEPFWRETGDKTSLLIQGWQSMSYVSNASNICWFLEPRLEQEVRRIHQVVGNAQTEGYHIVVGTGSSQLLQSVLFALSPEDAPEPMSVVSAVPYYSVYPALANFAKTRLHHWAGDANTFQGDRPYIEFVCSPCNPDGHKKEAVVNQPGGKTIHDLAYYWPQYTAITSKSDHNIMLFTLSKCTGHAGSRIGWALVKDKDVAKKMISYLEVATIGVSKDSQFRAAKILSAISDGYEHPDLKGQDKFFHFGHRLLTKRWEQLREAVKLTNMFSLTQYSSEFCNFMGHNTEPHPGFAWLKSEREDIEDLGEFLRGHKILTRNGSRFGVESKYVRVSMLDTDESFEIFIRRLLSMR